MGPILLIDAHWSVGKYGSDGYSLRPYREYFQSDPKIWEEIKAIYDRYMREPDASNHHKTRYAVIATYTGHWKEANLLFKSMRMDQRGMSVLYDNKALDELVAEAATEYKKQAEANRAVRVAAGNSTVNDYIISARWGGGKVWVDVTKNLQEWVAGDDDFWADNESLGSDPTPGWGKTLEIKYKIDGEEKTLKIAENKLVPREKLKGGK